jgi:hypothetical protein
MTQERLNDLGIIALESKMLKKIDYDLGIIALESKMLKKIDYEHIIEDFISNNTRRMMLFK